MIPQPSRAPAEDSSQTMPDVVEFVQEEEEGIEPGGEEIDYKVRRAQEKLLMLRQQQELIERQKRELEEISRKQDELDQNRAILRDLIGRSIIQIEREVFENEGRIETMRQGREILAGHLVRIDSIDPRSWEPSSVRSKLSQALAEIDAARADFERVRAKIGAIISDSAALPSEADSGQVAEAGFVETLKRGFAFTLPLLVVGAIVAGLLAAILARITPVTP